MTIKKEIIHIKLTGEDKKDFFINQLLAMPFFETIRGNSLDVSKVNGNSDIDVLLTLSGVTANVVIEELINPLREMTDTVRSAYRMSSEELDEFEKSRLMGGQEQKDKSENSNG